MQTKKSTLYTIIVLLVIFMPIAIYGLISKINLNNKAKIDNPNHEFFYKGALYFYNDNDELLGKYQCVSSECGYAKGIIDDNDYGVDYYQNGEKDNLVLPQADYVFIQDGDDTILYNLTLNEKIITYEAIKYYNMDLATNILFAKYDGKWGILSLDSMTPVLEYKYDFIGLPNNLVDNKLATDNFIVLANDTWSILDNNYQEIVSGFTTPIKSFNEKYIVTTDNKIYDYNQTEVIPNIIYKDVYIVNKYLILISNDNMVSVWEDLSLNNVGVSNISDYDTIFFVLDEGNVLSVYTDGAMVTTIDLV